MNKNVILKKVSEIICKYDAGEIKVLPTLSELNGNFQLRKNKIYEICLPK